MFLQNALQFVCFFGLLLLLFLPNLIFLYNPLFPGFPPLKPSVLTIEYFYVFMPQHVETGSQKHPGDLYKFNAYFHKSHPKKLTNIKHHLEKKRLSCTYDRVLIESPKHLPNMSRGWFTPTLGQCGSQFAAFWFHPAAWRWQRNFPPTTRRRLLLGGSKRFLPGRKWRYQKKRDMTHIATPKTHFARLPHSKDHDRVLFFCLISFGHQNRN